MCVEISYCTDRGAVGNQVTLRKCEVTNAITLRRITYTIHELHELHVWCLLFDKFALFDQGPRYLNSMTELCRLDSGHKEEPPSLGFYDLGRRLV